MIKLSTKDDSNRKELAKLLNIPLFTKNQTSNVKVHCDPTNPQRFVIFYRESGPQEEKKEKKEKHKKKSKDTYGMTVASSKEEEKCVQFLAIDHEIRDRIVLSVRAFVKFGHMRLMS